MRDCVAGFEIDAEGEIDRVGDGGSFLGCSILRVSDVFVGVDER